MTDGRRLSPDLRGRLPELGLMLLVVAGFAWTVNRFVVDGRLPQPFIYDPSDTFMDWFNTAYWSHHSGTYSVWRAVYPPLSFAFLKVFGIPSCYTNDAFAARDCDWVGIAAIYVSYIGCVVLAFLSLRKADPGTAVFRGVAFGIGLPLIFTLERGNLILPCFWAFVIAHGDLTRSRWARALAAALTINFKPYLLAPVLGLLVQRRWRALELAGIASIVVYIVSYAIVGEGSPAEMAANAANWVQFVGSLWFEGIYYTTSYAPFLNFNNDKFPTRDFIDGRTVDMIMAAIPVAIRVTEALAALAIVGAWLQPRALPARRVAAMLLAASMAVSSPGGYGYTFLVFLVFLEPWERPGPIVAIVSAYLLCVPYDYVLSRFVTLEGNSWLAGHSVTAPLGMAVGSFLRPALGLAIAWGLALDSIWLAARAHREHRPILHPHPRFAGAAE